MEQGKQINKNKSVLELLKSYRTDSQFFGTGDLLCMENSAPKDRWEIIGLRDDYPASIVLTESSKKIATGAPFMFLEWAAYDGWWAAPKDGQKEWTTFVWETKFLIGMIIFFDGRTCFITDGWGNTVDDIKIGPERVAFLKIMPHIKKWKNEQ